MTSVALCATVRHYGQTSEWESAIETANIVFTTFFAAELALRLIALGPKMFWCEGVKGVMGAKENIKTLMSTYAYSHSLIFFRRGGWNKLDLVIVIAGIIELFIFYMFPTVGTDEGNDEGNEEGNEMGNEGTEGALRAMRAMRAMHLALAFHVHAA